MKFGCPYCQTFCERGNSSAGSIITCPNCGRDFQISTLPTANNPPPRPAQSTPSTKGKIWSWIVLVVVILLVWRIVASLNNDRYHHEQTIAQIDKAKSDNTGLVAVVTGVLTLIGTCIWAASSSGD